MSESGGNEDLSAAEVFLDIVGGPDGSDRHGALKSLAAVFGLAGQLEAIEAAAQNLTKGAPSGGSPNDTPGGP
ncbi:MAG TPA: hypothetical protein PKX87_09965 [Alphaproteobacteria bacterium]|nr:hypothetical protein [Alphaproteobacteria bacterium]